MHKEKAKRLREDSNLLCDCSLQAKSALGSLHHAGTASLPRRPSSREPLHVRTSAWEAMPPINYLGKIIVFSFSIFLSNRLCLKLYVSWIQATFKEN